MLFDGARVGPRFRPEFGGVGAFVGGLGLCEVGFRAGDGWFGVKV